MTVRHGIFPFLDLGLFISANLRDLIGQIFAIELLDLHPRAARCY